MRFRSAPPRPRSSPRSRRQLSEDLHHLTCVRDWRIRNDGTEAKTMQVMTDTGKGGCRLNATGIALLIARASAVSLIKCVSLSVCSSGGRREPCRRVWLWPPRSEERGGGKECGLTL